jgi:hypothetical protein
MSSNNLSSNNLSSNNLSSNNLIRSGGGYRCRECIELKKKLRFVESELHRIKQEKDNENKNILSKIDILVDLVKQVN